MENKIPDWLSSLVLKGEFCIIITTNMVNAIEEFCKDHNKDVMHGELMKVLTGFYYARYLQVERRKYENDGIGIYSGILKNIFGQRTYQEVKKDCLGLTLTLPKKYNYKTGQLNRYKLKVDVLDGIPIRYFPVITLSFTERVKQMELRQYRAAYNADKIWGDKRVENANGFLFLIRKYFTGKQAGDFLNGMYQQGIFHGKQYPAEQLRFQMESMLHMFIHNGKYYTTKPDRNGRIYNLFGFLYKEMRGLLGEDYLEIDFSCHHPFLLGILMEYLMEGDTRKLNHDSNFIGKIKKQLVNFLKEDQVEVKKLGIEELQGWNIDSMTNVELLNRLEGWKWKKGDEVDGDEMIKPKYQFVLCLVVISFLRKELKYNLNHNGYLYSVTQGGESLISEMKILREHTQKGTFYDFITEYHKENLLLFSKRSGCISDNHKTIPPEEVTPFTQKQIIKKCFMFWMNSKPSTRANETDFYRPVFPVLDKLFSHLKDTFGYTCLHSLISTMESNIVFDIIDQCSNKSVVRGSRPFLCGSIHDAFYVRKEKLPFLEKVIGIKTQKHFGDTPYVKVKELYNQYLAEDIFYFSNEEVIH